MDYREAGVDITAADEAKGRIKALAKGTFNASVLSEIGSFGGMFRPDWSRYREPVLVASTDGVGTKIKVAIAAGVHDTVGYDLVAHCVNDILVQGATPLFFLDYIALGKMDPPRVEAIVSGFARGCSEFGCPLIGGGNRHKPRTSAVRALAHITGGGLPGNIPRVLPGGLGARVRRGSWEVPSLFRLIQKGGAVSDEEMFRTFNMGIGMVVVVAPEDLHEVEHSLERRGETSFVIGSGGGGSGAVFG